MPTVSYIAETAIDRYYERGGEHAVKPPPVFVCEVCDAEFQTPLELSKHRPEAHPQAPPRLLIEDRPIIGSQTIRRPLLPESVRVLAATEIEIRTQDGSEIVSESDLAALLAGQRRAHVTLTLRNRQTSGGPAAEETLQLSFDIPDPTTLDSADSAFESAFDKPDVTPEQLEAFDASTRQLESGRAYASALYDYSAALAMKDGTIPSPGDRLVVVRHRLETALAVLHDFKERPVARAACGFIRFALNDVRRWNVAGVPDLDNCAAMLSTMVDPSWQPPRIAGHSGAKKSFPVDAASALLVQAWITASDSSRFIGFAQHDDWTFEDVVKAKALALVAWEDDEPAEPSLITTARSLVHDPLFGEWADAWLKTRGMT